MSWWRRGTNEPRRGFSLPASPERVDDEVQEETCEVLPANGYVDPPPLGTVIIAGGNVLGNQCDTLPVSSQENSRTIVRVPTEPAYVEKTRGVPVIVAFVRLPIVKATPLFPVTVMLPVPKARVLTLALEAKNVRDVRLKLLRLSVP
mgnify:CR=1 FL=1